jgi:hypothetical protein
MKLTGKTIDGHYPLGPEPRRIGKYYDVPTFRRVTVTLDGNAYEGVIYERTIWSSMVDGTVVARFVTIDGINYEVEDPTPLKTAARARWKIKSDEPTIVYVFEDGISWMAYDYGDNYALRTEVDGRPVTLTVRDDHLNTEDADKFTDACNLLDKLANGWRPINWQHNV